jgi:hypothetical protein|tara:strand:- start:900 stop:1154 length:255 start_codon:yes stop_codon:yes gene_type:complete
VYDTHSLHTFPTSRSSGNPARVDKSATPRRFRRDVFSRFLERINKLSVDDDDDDDDVVGSEVAPPACPEFALARRCFARRNSSS